MTKLKLILPATWNQYLLFLWTSHLTIHQSSNSACRLHLPHAAFLWRPLGAALALRRSFYHYYKLICSNFLVAYVFETCKPITLTDTRAFLQAYMDPEGMHFFASQTALKGKAELHNLCTRLKSKLTLTRYKDVQSTNSCSYWGGSKGCNKTVLHHLKSRNNILQPKSQYSNNTWSWKSHQWWCDLLPDGQGKDSKVKEEQWTLFTAARNTATDLGCWRRQHSLVLITSHATDCTFILSIEERWWKMCIFTPMQLKMTKTVRCLRSANVTYTQASAPAAFARWHSCCLWLGTSEQSLLGEAFKTAPAAQSYLPYTPYV